MATCLIQGWHTGSFKCLRELAPDYLAKKIKTRSQIHNRDTRNKNKIDISGYRTAAAQRTFHYRTVSLKSLPGEQFL